MLISAKTLSGYNIQASDGEIGYVDELYFDTDSWLLRYFVVNVGNWLLKQHVLLAPEAVEQIDTEREQVLVNLTREEVKNSPDIETQKTISREKELALHEYYNWQPYWKADLVGTAALGTYPAVPTVPAAPIPPRIREDAAAVQRAREDNPGSNNLESTAEVAGYTIKASDGDIGRVDDFIVDAATWTIRYLVIDTGGWLPGRKVLISPGWVKSVHWPDGEVYVAMTQESIRNSPDYEPAALVNRDYEAALYEYYDEPPYWRS
jgi:uncharacterized protein YrrD